MREFWGKLKNWEMREVGNFMLRCTPKYKKNMKQVLWIIYGGKNIFFGFGEFLFLDERRKKIQNRNYGRCL